NRLGWNRWMDHHNLGKADDARDGRDVADKIEIELFVERRIDRVCRCDQEKRVAIRGRTHDRLGADVGAATRPVVDDELLAKPLRQPLSHQTRDDVVPAASGGRNDHAHRPRRIGLRSRDARDGRQHSAARSQMQKLSAGKFHFEPPFTSFDDLIGAAGYLYVCSPAGRRTVNTEPFPGSLVTHTSPPIMRASFRVMARPSPVPRKCCGVVASAWLNSSNSLACCSAVMPMPVSETANSTKLLPLLTLRAASLTSPALVNLQALLRRLSSICRSRMGSTVRVPRFSWASTTRRFLFCSVSCSAVSMTSLISGASCTVCGL